MSNEWEWENRCGGCERKDDEIEWLRDDLAALQALIDAYARWDPDSEDNLLAAATQEDDRG